MNLMRLKLIECIFERCVIYIMHRKCDYITRNKFSTLDLNVKAGEDPLHQVGQPTLVYGISF